MNHRCMCTCPCALCFIPIGVIQRIRRCENETLRHMQERRRNIRIPTAGDMSPEGQTHPYLWKIRQKSRHERMVPPFDLHNIRSTNGCLNFLSARCTKNLHPIGTANVNKVRLLRLLQQQNAMPIRGVCTCRIRGNAREHLANTAAHMCCNMQYFAHRSLLHSNTNGLTNSSSEGNNVSRSDRIGWAAFHGIPAESHRTPASQSGA